MARDFKNGLSTTAIRLGSTATAGQVLTTDASGNGSWQAITGTTNYINSVKIDQTPAATNYGLLAGSVNGANAVFTVSNGSYIPGTLKVWQNGLLRENGSAYDWQETSPSSGTFTFSTAPTTGDIITVAYVTTVSSTGSLPETSSVKTADYTVSSTDKNVYGDTSAGPINLTWFDATAFPGRVIRIKNIGSATNNVLRITPFSGQTIDGAPSRTLQIYDEITVATIGGALYVIGSYYPATARSIYGQTTVKAGDALAAAATSGFVTIGTTLTNFASNVTLPANGSPAGTNYFFDFMGTYTNSGVGPSTTAQVRMNSTTIVTTAALTSLGAGTFGYSGRIHVKIQSVGTTGSVRAGGTLHFATSNMGSVTVVVPATVTTINTTIDQVMSLALQYSSATAGNTNTLQQLDITEMRAPKAAN